MFYRLSKEQQKAMLEDIQTFFELERDEEISEFQAERLLDFIKESLAPHFYNAGVRDAQQLVERQFLSLEDEMYTLIRSTK